MEVIKIKIVTFSNLKGGTGKSNVLFNISGVLAEDKKTVLILDLDAQGNISNNYGIDRTKKDLNTVVDIFENRGNAELEHMVVSTKLRHVFIVPGDLLMTKTEIKIVAEAGREYILQNFLEDNKEFLEKFDYILIDTNPSFNIINQNAFVVSDSIILVNDTSLNSLEGSEQFTALWREIRRNLRLEDNVKAFIINNYDKRRKIDKDFIEFIQKHEEFGSILIEPPIPNNVKYKEAELEAKPVFKGIPYMTYKKVVKELIGRMVL